MVRVFQIGLVLLSLILFLNAREAKSAERIDPYACTWFVDQVAPEDYKKEIARRLETVLPQTADDYPYRFCIIAEVMKRVGDTRVPYYYELAIKEHPEEPGLEMFYADYLQFIRGVRFGLVVDATRRYERAREKIAALKAQKRWGEKSDARTERELERGLLLLNRPDGFPLLVGNRKPDVFLSTVNEIRRDTVAFDYQWVDSREFASEVLFAESPSRLNRRLTESELKSIARDKFGAVSANRVRFRIGDLRAIDISYRYLRFNDAKISNFFEPTQFTNDVGHEYGIALQQDFQLPRGFDLFLTGTATSGRRTTAAEFFGGRKEDNQQYGFVGGLSRVIGAGKLSGEFGFAHQNWHPGLNWDRINTFSSHVVYQSKLFGLNRLVLDGQFTYQDVDPSRFSPGNKNMWSLVLQGGYEFPVPGAFFRDRIHSGELFGGYVNAVRTVGSGNNIDQQELFGGLALRGIEVTKGTNPFDIKYRIAYYDSDADDAPTQKHAELRNEITIGYRIVDASKVQWLVPGERRIEPAFINLEIPLRKDTRIDGPNDFENYRVGLRLSGEFVQTSKSRPFTFYGSLGYDFERFYKLDKNFHLFMVRLGTGF